VLKWRLGKQAPMHRVLRKFIAKAGTVVLRLQASRSESLENDLASEARVFSNPPLLILREVLPSKWRLRILLVSTNTSVPARLPKMAQSADFDARRTFQKILRPKSRATPPQVQVKDGNLVRPKLAHESCVLIAKLSQMCELTSS
jgi:hypothetical protein